MDDVEIRAARGGDLNAAARLRWCWGAEAGTPLADGLEDFVAAFVTWAREHAASHSCTVVACGDHVIGMAWLATVPRPPSPGALTRLSGDVQSVYIVPEERGRGWGGRLVLRVLAAAAARGLEHVTVHSSAAAVSLYARAGFTSDPRTLTAVLPTA